MNTHILLPVLGAALFFLAFAGSAKALSLEEARWRALAELESGNNPRALGSHGEVTEYQIMPEHWGRLAGAAQPHNRKINRIIAELVWVQNRRVARIQYPVDNWEWAYVWHCPGRYRNQQLTAADKNYADRFTNLVIYYAKN